MGVNLSRPTTAAATNQPQPNTPPQKQILRKAAARLAVEKPPGAALPMPDTTEAALRMHLEEMPTFTVLVGAVSKG